jgi:peptide/nickel transport system permease protein
MSQQIAVSTPTGAVVRTLAGRRRGERRPLYWIGCVILSVVTVACAVVPLVSPYGTQEFVGDAFQPPSSEHLFGTDGLGRDVFTRAFAGGLLDLAIAVVVVGASLLIGGIIGAVAGITKRRWLDGVIARIIDSLIAFPFVVLVLALVVVFGYDRTIGPIPPGIPAVAAALIVVNWTVYARLVRAETMTLSRRSFVVAAQTSGYSMPRVIGRHLLPGVMRVAITYAVADVILVITYVASLSFLGAGAQPPTPEWGAIMYEGRGVLFSAWWITFGPGLLLALTGLSLAFIADSLLEKGDAA